MDKVWEVGDAEANRVAHADGGVGGGGSVGFRDRVGCSG